MRQVLHPVRPCPDIAVARLAAVKQQGAVLPVGPMPAFLTTPQMFASGSSSSVVGFAEHRRRAVCGESSISTADAASTRLG